MNQLDAKAYLDSCHKVIGYIQPYQSEVVKEMQIFFPIARALTVQYIGEHASEQTIVRVLELLMHQGRLARQDLEEKAAKRVRVESQYPP